MKILLTKNDKDLDDYYTIKTHEEIEQITEDDLEQLDEIRVDDMQLGLDCLFWLVDHHLCYLDDRIKFTLMMPDWQECQDFKYFLKKYLHKLERIRNYPVEHGKKLQGFSTL